jgi:hypothetical protein
LIPDPDLQKELVEDVTKEENNEQLKQEIAEEKNGKEEKNAQIIADLKSQLNDSELQKKTLEDLVKQFKESEEINR